MQFGKEGLMADTRWNEVSRRVWQTEERHRHPEGGAFGAADPARYGGNYRPRGRNDVPYFGGQYQESEPYERRGQGDYRQDYGNEGRDYASPRQDYGDEEQRGIEGFRRRFDADYERAREGRTPSYGRDYGTDLRAGYVPDDVRYREDRDFSGESYRGRDYGESDYDVRSRRYREGRHYQGGEYEGGEQYRVGRDYDEGFGGYARETSQDERFAQNERYERYQDEGRGYSGERGWWDRTADEVRSWMGDRGAEQRRQMDAVRDRRNRGPRGYRRSDERILEDVSERMASDFQLDSSDIEVTAHDSEVTLSGTVVSRSAKRRAEDIADSVLGVRHVQNNLRVRVSDDDSSSMRSERLR